MVEGQTYDDLAHAGEDLAAAAQQVGVDRWPRFIGDASHQAVEAVAQGAFPGVIKANATGTDTGQVVVLGGFALLLYLTLGGKHGAPAPNPASSKPIILQQEEKKETQPTPEQATPAADPQSSSPEAVVSDERRTHILEGDKTGGGHRPGRSLPGKVNSRRVGPMIALSKKSKAWQMTRRLLGNLGVTTVSRLTAPAMA